MNSKPRATIGAMYALAAYGAWGLFPLYWKQLGHVGPLEILAQRVVWSFVVVAIGLTARKRWRDFAQPFGHGKTLLALCASTALIAVNWYLFIYAVNAQRVIEASFGYFLTPLVNVLLGVIVMRESLSRAQRIAMVLAACGVGWIAMTQPRFPWLGLALAATFGLYGLVRKRVNADALVGLSVETALLFVPALAFLATTPIAFGSDTQTTLLLAGAGLVTALPLVWFAAAVRLLPLSIIGFFQYIAPSVQFLLATVVYGEPFNQQLLVGFACIWGALGVVSYALVSASRRAENPSAA